MKTVLEQNILEEERGRPLALRETYLAMIRGSVGSNQYRHLFVKEQNGRLDDVIGDGDLACAYFFSSILTLCHLLKKGPHVNVTETITDMLASGWKQTDKLEIGAAIVWGKKLCTDGIYHRHIGFYLNRQTAVSNCSKAKTPVRHHRTFGFEKWSEAPVRPIEAIFFHDALRA